MYGMRSATTLNLNLPPGAKCCRGPTPIWLHVGPRRLAALHLEANQKRPCEPADVLTGDVAQKKNNNSQGAERCFTAVRQSRRQRARHVVVPAPFRECQVWYLLLIERTAQQFWASSETETIA